MAASNSLRSESSLPSSISDEPWARASPAPKAAIAAADIQIVRSLMGCSTGKILPHKEWSPQECGKKNAATGGGRGPLHRHAAVDAEDLAGDVGREVAREEEDRPRDFLGFP